MKLLSHFSDVRIERVRMPEDKQGDDAYKPSGFWVSVDGEDDWEEWCKAEEFRPAHLAVRHRVTLTPSANVLLLSTADEVFDFGRTHRSVRTADTLRGINWRGVAATWDGIIIAPYQWSCRLADGCSWYYGWDCASGCIWRPRAIASIDVISDERKAAA